MVGEKTRMSSAREEILARIRQACVEDAVDAADSYVRIAREYQQTAKLSREEILGLLTGAANRV